MENKIVFTSVAVLAIFIAFFGIFLVIGNTGPTIFSNSAFAMVSSAIFKHPGVLLTSFDNFKNIHKVILDKNKSVKIFDIEKGSGTNNFWMATNEGLFLSIDGGLIWNKFTSSNREIDVNSKVFAIVPLSNDGKSFVISTFKNNVGVVYLTNDEFFDLKKLISFDDEVPYVIYKVGNILYFGMSTGQIIRYDINKKYARVINVFNKPVISINHVPYRGFYVLLSSGQLMYADILNEDFNKIKIPVRNIWDLLSNKSIVDDIQWDNSGNIYILSNNRLFISKLGAKALKIFKTIPIIKEKINAISIRGDVIRVISENKMLTSKDGGVNWYIKDIDGISRVSKIYYVSGRIFFGE